MLNKILTQTKLSSISKNITTNSLFKLNPSKIQALTYPTLVKYNKGYFTTTKPESSEGNKEPQQEQEAKIQINCKIFLLNFR